ncbi:hypothetical protein BSU04_46585 [Caballeronia sordidicola]|uniref:Uncharacterized protein n=1 Tax=Caballeronia sordidicola TaxID=196367 RepID=A0A226WJU6_CABSO|nr:hypothetical protein BSU04_46585 [Caballeronia sordidicola]
MSPLYCKPGERVEVESKVLFRTSDTVESLENQSRRIGLDAVV